MSKLYGVLDEGAAVWTGGLTTSCLVHPLAHLKATHECHNVDVEDRDIVPQTRYLDRDTLAEVRNRSRGLRVADILVTLKGVSKYGPNLERR